MVKRLIIFYMALHLAFSPVASALASTACSSILQAESAPCKHHSHQAVAAQQQDRAISEAKQNCHDSGQDTNSRDRCSCHYTPSVAGLLNTFVARITENVTAPIVSPLQTQPSVTDTPIYKPPRV
jgi:hypothetical protein